MDAYWVWYSAGTEPWVCAKGVSWVPAGAEVVGVV